MSPGTDQYHDAFFDESFDALDAMEAALLRLASGTADSEAIHSVFRVTHSIKGGAGMFSFAEIASYTHAVEALLNELRAGRLLVTAPICDGLLQSVDVIRSMLAGRKTHGEAAVAAPVAAAVVPKLDSIRVSVEKLDLLQQCVDQIAGSGCLLAQLAKNLAGTGAHGVDPDLAQFDADLRALRDSVMRLRMLPAASVFNRFPRLVHDLAARLGKQTRLRLSGGQIELDKTVLEKIADPLVHLVRNSIDHGIELPAERMAAGKPAEGLVELKAFCKDTAVHIVVSDDGRGLDSGTLVARARDQGLLDPAAVLTDAQAHELVFVPGFTTVERATELSGRGVGMDVVSRNIRELGGSVELHSQPGKGTVTTIILPLALAVIDGQVVQVGPETFMVPILQNTGG